MDTREWRVGSHYGIHLYAVNVDAFHDEPLGTALNPEIAEQIASEHADAIHRRQERRQHTAGIDLLTAERDNAKAKATRWSEKVEKLADENDELARKLNAAVELHDHKVVENHCLRAEVTKLDKKLAESVCAHNVTKDRVHDLFAENERLRGELNKNDKLTEKLDTAERSRDAALDENGRLSDKLKRNVKLTDRAIRSRDELSAENHRLQVELRKAMAVKYLWPIVGDRVRHLRHGGTGTVVATAEGRESTVEVKNEFGEPCYWFLKNLEPLYAKDGWVSSATDECAD